MLITIVELPDFQKHSASGDLIPGSGGVRKLRWKSKGKGKSGSGRTIVCYKKKDRIIFIHGFAKNEKSNLTKKELAGFKEFAQILLDLSPKEIKTAIKNGDFIEVKSWEIPLLNQSQTL